ncbi:glutamate--tRNA ligase [Maritalea mediterranea]|uniref:Glutamate--tRNA ligase n=1 Tax=Maritalea mediterranea TaxID=2909667 RepID=A0ABS9E774_9HYPH|nr:glutamate--tRNA ligase [Maritalea mediterranea]MCF4098032.1 glutamate--tRNA ligase [Maritalea mediterranea]
MSTVVRFAPSPTGYIHLGNARPALMNWMFALKTGGQFILRFDDTDLERSKKEYADAIEKDLAWLGIKPHRLERQSERKAAHDAARDKLIADGRLYPCYETADELDRRRKRARAMGRPPIYDRAALKLTDEEKAAFEAEGRKPHWRFKLEGKEVHFDDVVRGDQVVNTDTMSDPVLIRADGSYLYTLPSVVDDIDMGVTHVIRGEDHVTNTGAQIELFEALGATPPTFGHHNLLTDATGEGFSKRKGSLSITNLREEGYEAMAVALIAILTGTSQPVAPHNSLEELAQTFDISMVSRSAARFDPAELSSFNARMVHGMSYENVKDRLAEMGVNDGEQLWNAVHENLEKVQDIRDWQKLVAGPVNPVVAKEDKDFIATAAERLPAEPWDENTWSAWTNDLKAETGRKGKQLFMPLRLALTGQSHGPELKTLLPLLGRKACLDRLS